MEEKESGMKEMAIFLVRVAQRVSLVMLFSGLILFSCYSSSSIPVGEDKPSRVDSVQYPLGYPHPKYSALEQLQRFPSPRYFKGNKLLRLFNWMDPMYMGGDGQPGMKKKDAIENSVALQLELGSNWNYGIVLPNSGYARTDGILNDANNPGMAYIKLANAHPEIPFDVITFWVQLHPNTAGYRYSRATILSENLSANCYTHYKWKGTDRKEINFNFPDSLIMVDGMTQRYYLANLLKKLKRPLDRINENGEEPPGMHLYSQMMKDKNMTALKEKRGKDNWFVFVSKEKVRMRNRYSSCFLDSLPELKNTFYSVYATEGGPIDRFAWEMMRKCMTPVGQNYYSTPDFYPRWPSNWKTWKSAWHGWKWISDGRKIELKQGDELFSPFVCAGWANDPEMDIRPAQWLGLLKCLSAAGAEFFYVGYFNISSPFNDPAEYVWQAAMASYAQAITSRYELDLKNGMLMRGTDKLAIVELKTSDPNVLLVVRKNKAKERYVICGTIQPFSNNANEVPEKKIVTAEFNGEKIKIEVRRQGSVYVYDKSLGGPPVFYQLDAWHEAKHPDRWSRDLYYEAEVQDGGIPLPVVTETRTTEAGDYSDFTSYIELSENTAANYSLTLRDTLIAKRYMCIRYKADADGELSVTLNGRSLSEKKARMNSSESWKWKVIEIPGNYFSKGSNALVIAGDKKSIKIDKFIITDDKTPSFIKN